MRLATQIPAGTASAIIPEQDFPAYLGDPALSFSVLDKIRESPAAVQAFLKDGVPDSAALLQGRGLHTSWLEASKVAERIAFFPGATRSGQAWQGFKVRSGAKDVLTKREAERISGACSALDVSPATAQLRAGALIEASLFWTRQGVRCKCRPDILKDGTIYDLKFVADASEEGFARALAKFGWHRRAAWYLDGATAATGSLVSDYIFVLIEKKAPHKINLFQVDANDLAAAGETNAASLLTYERCQRTNNWPAPSGRVRTVSVPRWAR